MEFDESRVYTTLNADKLKIGSKVVVDDTLASLRNKVNLGRYEVTLKKIKPDDNQYRFIVAPIQDCEADEGYALAYLVEEPEEKKLRWTDLKVGDVITNKKITSMVVRIDTDDVTHILAGNVWLNDEELKEWEKVENENEKLKAQIEKMKKCFNCKYHNTCVEGKCDGCLDYSNWELVHD